MYNKENGLLFVAHNGILRRGKMVKVDFFSKKNICVDIFFSLKCVMKKKVMTRFESVYDCCITFSFFEKNKCIVVYI